MPHCKCTNPARRWQDAIVGLWVGLWLAWTPAAARADDATLAMVSSICANVGKGGEFGLRTAEATLAAFTSSLQGDVNKLENWQSELGALRGTRDELSTKMSQMGGSAESGANIIRREADGRRKAWRDQFKPQLDALRAEGGQIDQQITTATAELSQAEQDLKNEQDKPWLSRSSDAVARLAQRVEASKASLAAHRQARTEKSAAVTEKQAELDSFVAAEDSAMQQKLAAHAAGWQQAQSRHAEYLNKIAAKEAAVTTLQASLGKRQFAAKEAGLCIKTARGSKGGSSTTTGSYDPNKDPALSTPPRPSGGGRGGTDTQTGEPAPGTKGGDAGGLGGGAPGQGPGYSQPAGGQPSTGATDKTTTGLSEPAMPGGIGGGAGGLIGYPPGLLPRGPIGAPLPPRPPVDRTGTAGGTVAAIPPITPPAASAAPPATGQQCDAPLCREMSKANCESLGSGFGDCSQVSSTLPSCGRSNFTLAEVKAACYQNMKTRCDQGMSGRTGGWCVRDKNCVDRAHRTCGCNPSTHPQCSGKWG